MCQRYLFIACQAFLVWLFGYSLFMMGWLAGAIAGLAAVVMAASLYDFCMATAGHYRACDARPAAWWATVSGAVLAVVVMVWF